MAQYIDKAAVVAEIERRMQEHHSGYLVCLKDMLSFIDTLDVKDPYEQCVQYDSIKAGIQDYAETYSFNIESILFNQLTKEQQELWRKEIEQAFINGGEAGVELARDPRYKENLEAKKVREEPVNEDLEEAAEEYAPDFSDSVASKAVVDAVRNAFKAGAQWQALHSIETIKGMEEQAFLAGVEAEQINKCFPKEELLNKWRNKQ